MCCIPCGGIVFLSRGKIVENLLEILRQGKMSALPELAERLQTSEELLLARLERYEQLGYVRRVCVDGTGCGGSCKKCRGCSGRRTGEAYIYWEKGEKLQ